MTDKPKIIFAPGCFDNFDGTEEELADLMAQLHTMVENGTLMDSATRLTPEEEEELAKVLAQKGLRQ